MRGFTKPNNTYIRCIIRIVCNTNLACSHVLDIEFIDKMFERQDRMQWKVSIGRDIGDDFDQAWSEARCVDRDSRTDGKLFNLSRLKVFERGI